MDDPRDLLKTEKTTLHRRKARGSYDRAAAYAILDEALFCTLAAAGPQGPVALPMAFGRWDDRLILHGARSHGLLAAAAAGAPVCVAVTLIDGLVLARSAMHHSMNYRSVVLFGALQELVTTEDKLTALDCVVNHAWAGRAQETRSPNATELHLTRVFALPIEEASVKVRTGGPVDDEADLPLPYWAGEVPLALRTAAGITDPTHAPCAPRPAALGGPRKRVGPDFTEV